MKRKVDFAVGMLFAAATVILIIVFLTNDRFFAWAFERHHNILSWYIRPLFIFPIVIFAFKKSLAGIFASIFALFTSMFWFPAPEKASPWVLEFLAFEMDYLKGEWNLAKVLATIAVPVFFIMLLASAWQRKPVWLLGVIVGAAVLKSAWSVAFGGEAGFAVLAPAVVGLAICVGGLGFYFYKKKNTGKE